MSTLLIPTRTDGTPWYDMSIQLDGASYYLEFMWNPREQQWYLSISDANEVLLLSERRISLGLPLLARFRIAGLPLGEIVAIDTSGSNVEAGLTELGARVHLLYIELASLPAGYASS
jgi:hypothetical protein